MPFVAHTFDSELELVDYLNDIIVGKPVGMGPFNLDGLTLTIAGNLVTFSGTELRWPQIVAQINAVSSGSASLRNYGHQSPPSCRLAFVTATELLAASGTAKAILGLPAAATTVGANAVAKADIVSILKDGEGNRFTVIHE